MKNNKRLIRHAQVTERDNDSASARVTLDDLESTVSGKMQVLFPAIGGWNVFYTPKEHDHVVITRFPNGGEEGLILGKTFTATKMPQGGADNIFLMVSDNGKNVIRFDADNGTLDLFVDQNARFKFKNFDKEVKEHTHLKTKTQHTEVEESQKTEVGTTIDTESGGDNTTLAGGDINKKAAGKFYMGNSAQNMCKLLLGLIDEIIAIRTFGPPPRHRIQPDTVARFEAYKNEVTALLKGGM